MLYLVIQHGYLRFVNLITYRLAYCKLYDGMLPVLYKRLFKFTARMPCSGAQRPSR